MLCRRCHQRRSFNTVFTLPVWDLSPPREQPFYRITESILTRQCRVTCNNVYSPSSCERSCVWSATVVHRPGMSHKSERQPETCVKERHRPEWQGCQLVLPGTTSCRFNVVVGGARHHNWCCTRKITFAKFVCTRANVTLLFFFYIYRTSILDKDRLRGLIYLGSNV